MTARNYTSHGDVEDLELSDTTQVTGDQVGWEGKT